VDDEINQLNRCIDNAKLFHHLWESRFKELVIQLNNDALFAGSVVDISRPHSDRFIELVQGVGILLDGLRLQQVEHPLHGDRYGVVQTPYFTDFSGKRVTNTLQKNGKHPTSFIKKA